MMPFVAKDISQSRYDHCKTCDEFENLIKCCKLCGCFMPAKTILASSRCPAGHWTAVEGDVEDAYSVDP